jgi:hypothetical protein
MPRPDMLNLRGAHAFMSPFAPFAAFKPMAGGATAGRVSRSSSAHVSRQWAVSVHSVSIVCLHIDKGGTVYDDERCATDVRGKHSVATLPPIIYRQDVCVCVFVVCLACTRATHVLSQPLPY